MSFKGKKNIYACKKCPCKIVTIDRDEGVTPFLTYCKSKGCQGFMQSKMYTVNQDLVPEYEWYQPENWQSSTNDHVRQGGLLLRKIDQEKSQEKELQLKYMELLHGIQSGIAYLMVKEPDMVSPKNLRVGIDSAHVSHAALISLLIEKGIFTKEEYLQSLCKACEEEIKMSEKELSEIYGSNVVLK